MSGIGLARVFLLFLCFYFLNGACSPKPSLDLFVGSNSLQQMNQSYAGVKGKIVDESGEGIANAEIQVIGSTLSSRTDSNGYFEMFNVPVGYSAFSVQANDYISKNETILISNSNEVSDPLTIELSKGIGITVKNSYDDNPRLLYLLDYKKSISAQIDSLITLRQHVGSKISENLDSASVEERNDPFFKPFRDLFVTENPERCTPINWAEGMFKEIRDGLPEMELVTPFNFTVINYDTGYLISVHLSGYRSLDDGLGLIYAHNSEFTFRELATDNTQLKSFWESNRKQLYLGSFPHFLSSLAAGKYSGEGFRVYGGQFSEANANSLGSSVVFSGDIELKKEDFLIPGNEENTFILSYSNDLKVEYNQRFMRQNYKYKGLNGFRYETSWLKLNRPAVLFSSNGNLQNSNSVSQNGLWGFRKVCDMLPLDYTP